MPKNPSVAYNNNLEQRSKKKMRRRVMWQQKRLSFAEYASMLILFIHPSNVWLLCSVPKCHFRKSFSSENQFNNHINSNKHKEKEATSSIPGIPALLLSPLIPLSIRFSFYVIPEDEIKKVKEIQLIPAEEAEDKRVGLPPPPFSCLLFARKLLITSFSRLWKRLLMKKLKTPEKFC